MYNGKPDFRWAAGTYDPNGRPYVPEAQNPKGSNERHIATLSWTGGIMVFGYTYKWYTGEAYDMAWYDAVILPQIEQRGSHSCAQLEDAKWLIEKAYNDAPADRLWDFVESDEALHFDTRYSS